MAQIATLPPAFSSSAHLPAAPAYDVVTSNSNLPADPGAGADLALPAYQPPVSRRSTDTSTALRQTVEHVYQSTNSKGRVWLTMKLNSRAPSAKSLPSFASEDTIAGEVLLDLEKQDTIQAVVVKVSASWLLCGMADLSRSADQRPCRWCK